MSMSMSEPEVPDNLEKRDTKFSSSKAQQSATKNADKIK